MRQISCQGTNLSREQKAYRLQGTATREHPEKHKKPGFYQKPGCSLTLKNQAASYACRSQSMSSASTSVSFSTRTLWLTMALNEPDASNLPVGFTPLRLMPTSTRVFVVGWTMANC